MMKQRELDKWLGKNVRISYNGRDEYGCRVRDDVGVLYVSIDKYGFRTYCIKDTIYGGTIVIDDEYSITHVELANKIIKCSQ